LLLSWGRHSCLPLLISFSIQFIYGRQECLPHLLNASNAEAQVADLLLGDQLR